MQQSLSKNKFFFALPALLLAGYFVFSNWLNFGYMMQSRQLWLFAAACIFTTLLFYGILLQTLRNADKAGLIGILTVIFFFFAIPIHTTLREWSWYRNTIIFPCYLFLITLLYGILIRKTLQSKLQLSGKLFQYMVLLPLLLAGWDGASAFLKLKKPTFYFNAVTEPKLQKPGNQLLEKPNILYVLFDMHGGNSTIQKQLKYDNRQLDSMLVTAGFRVWSNAYSPTNFTPTTMASVFQMQPLHKSGHSKNIHIRSMYEGGYLSQYNALTPFLKQQGYRVHNLGVMPIERNSKGIEHAENWGNPFKIITHQMLPVFIYNTYRWALSKLTAGRIAGKPKLIYDEDIRTSKYVLDSLNNLLTSSGSKQPQFVYAHLFIPHEPFKFDSSGNVLPWSKHMYYDGTLNQYYIQQIIYARKLMQQIIHASRSNPNQQWALIFQGDHGIRDHENGKAPSDVCHVLHTMYMPNNRWPAGIDTTTVSTTNTFRLVLNHLFEQQLPMLPVQFTTYEYVME